MVLGINRPIDNDANSCDYKDTIDLFSKFHLNF